jgi:hypothetical protein
VSHLPASPPASPDNLSFKLQNRRIAEMNEEQRRRQFVIDRGDLEYGIDTRAEAQASSYYGGMADVNHFGGNRTVLPNQQSVTTSPVGTSKPIVALTKGLS